MIVAGLHLIRQGSSRRRVVGDGVRKEIARYVLHASSGELGKVCVYPKVARSGAVEEVVRFHVKPLRRIGH